MRRRLKAMLALLVKAVERWVEHGAPTRSAAIAFFSITSLAPVSVLIVWIGAKAWERGSVRARVMERLVESLGPEAAALVTAVLNDATLPRGDALVPSIIGFVVFLVSATAAFSELQSALSEVWEAPTTSGDRVSSFLRQRGLALLLVGVLGLVLTASMAVTTVLTALAASVPAHVPFPLLRIADFGVSALTLIVLFTLVLRILPDAEVPWREAALGGVVTGVLHVVGQSVVGLYLGGAAIASAYGAAASVVVFLSWVYYSSMVFLLGAEVSRLLSVDAPGSPRTDERPAGGSDALARHPT